MNRISLALILVFVLLSQAIAAKNRQVKLKKNSLGSSIPAKQKVIDDVKIALKILSAAKASVFQRFIVTRSTTYLGMSSTASKVEPKATIIVEGLPSSPTTARRARLLFVDSDSELKKATYDEKSRIITIYYPWSRFEAIDTLLRRGHVACCYIAFSSGCTYADLHSYIAKSTGGSKSSGPKTADAVR